MTNVLIEYEGGLDDARDAVIIQEFGAGSYESTCTATGVRALSFQCANPADAESLLLRIQNIDQRLTKAEIA